MATSDEKSAAQILAGTSLAQGMNEEDLKELLASSEVTLRTYPKGAIVFHDGDMPTRFTSCSKEKYTSSRIRIRADKSSSRRSIVRAICSARSMKYCNGPMICMCVP